jgi:flagellar hook assembly protein FlgD
MRSSAIISYGTITSTEVSIDIYDRTGKLVRTIVDARQTSGVRKVCWDGNDSGGRILPGGVYFVRLVSPQYVKTGKIVVLR